MPGEAISKQELFARLAEGRAAGITVVTPNRRLAQVLKAEFDSFQADKQLPVWDEADILPLDAFAARCYEEALYSDAGGAMPMLLSPAQARELWEAAIAGSRWADALLDVPQTAARAMDAWRLAQQWRLAGGLEKFAANEDTRAFAEWAGSYARRLKKEGLVDLPLLFDLPIEFRKPTLLVAHAFDILPPQAADFFKRLEFVNSHPGKRAGDPRKTSFASPREELEAAAKWARARLEEGKQSIGVVVPDLELRRREAVRVFTRTMGFTAGSPLPFELSLGQPLADYPVVAFALSLLEFSSRALPFETVSRLIRSPFLGGAEREQAARARFDAALRREADGTLSLPKLIASVQDCPLLRKFLEGIFERKAEKQSPHDWARHFTSALDAAGFPGERVPDSAEYQARAKFNEVLGEFSRLSLVTPEIPFSRALAQLRRLCAETLFQPEGAGAPVQVLGLLESAGLEFDALWVSGLTDGAWPLRARPNPFLPVALQKKAGIPEASAESSLALDRRITADWAAAAEEVVFSWPRREEDRDLLPSPLIAEIAERQVQVPSFLRYRDLLFEARDVESFEDAIAPPIKDKTVRGGTRVLANQAACPFRAFARHRLRAEALEEPAPGPDAIDRGKLLHALMAGIWGELKTKQALSEDLFAVISRSAKKAVGELKLEGRFAELEVERLTRLAADWLAVEAARKDFSVAAVEKEVELSIANLSLRGRIDRMDRLADGSHALIDYKTGARVTPKDWDGPRPDDPQLPLYAVTAKERVSALAFAKLRPGDMKFSGFSAAAGEIPGVQAAKSWGGLVEGWKATLEGLAASFAAGDAQVDPKRGLTTCRNCDLHTLCRVHERLSALGEEEGET